MRLPDRIQYVQAATWLVLVWENAWKSLLPLICTVGLFLALGLLEFPLLLSPWLHIALLAVFILLSAGAIWFAVTHWCNPDRGSIIRRLETHSDLPHRPLSTMDDRLTNAHDAQAAIIWRIHQRRAKASLRDLRVGLPRPGLPLFDPWAGRAVVYLLLVAGLFVGGLEADERIARAFTPDFSATRNAPAELEAWLTPPEYTALPPLKLDPNSTEPVAVVQGSTLMLRVFGGAPVPRLLVDGAATPFKRIDERNFEFSGTIEAGQQLVVASGDVALAEWPVAIIADQPPIIDSDKPPQVTSRQALRLSYKASDDYGLARVWAKIRLPIITKTTNSGTDDVTEENARAEEEEIVSLELPISPPGAAKSQDGGYFDLTPHPWAGRRVMLHYLAKDQLGQVGKAEVVILRLPERQFHHPVARAIIEQRRILSQAPDKRLLVALALFAISSGPETYGDDEIAYLMIWTTARRLQLKRGKSVSSIMDILWKIALRIEDGVMSLAERELRSAQEALIAALSEVADQDEIERLMDQLQKTMDRYLQALAERAERNSQVRHRQPMDRNARTMDAKELQNMLDRIKELSRLGNRDAARKMLRHLQEILENLDSTRIIAQQKGQGPDEKAMQKLSDLLKLQRDLMDKTYQQTLRRRHLSWERDINKEGRSGSQGGANNRSRSNLNNLAGRQGDLRGQLGEIMRQLGDVLSKTRGAMDGVDQAMSDAQTALQYGRRGQALSAQRQAIDGLARSFWELAEKMMREAQEDGQGQFQQTQEDPAGRPFQGGGMDTSRVMVPSETDVQRARKILDELRRRAGERSRPRPERNYIERLLDRF
ncbi:MAG: TIGR02302 family protein [Alphaproteobacteria bacterium]